MLPLQVKCHRIFLNRMCVSSSNENPVLMIFLMKDQRNKDAANMLSYP